MDTLIFLLLALWCGFRLWSVLGRRPQRKQARTSPSKKGTKTVKGRVVYLHTEKKKCTDQKQDFASLFPTFNESEFLAGAKKACAMIIQGYHAQDMSLLASLVTPELLERLGSDFPIPAPPATPISATIDSKAIFEGSASVQILFKIQGEKDTPPQELVWVFERAIDSKDPNWLLSG